MITCVCLKGLFMVNIFSNSLYSQGQMHIYMHIKVLAFLLDLQTLWGLRSNIRIYYLELTQSKEKKNNNNNKLTTIKFCVYPIQKIDKAVESKF